MQNIRPELWAIMNQLNDLERQVEDLIGKSDDPQLIGNLRAARKEVMNLATKFNGLALGLGGNPQTGAPLTRKLPIEK
jgi:hypothetical protein